MAAKDESGVYQTNMLHGLSADVRKNPPNTILEYVKINERDA